MVFACLRVFRVCVCVSERERERDRHKCIAMRDECIAIQNRMQLTCWGVSDSLSAHAPLITSEGSVR